MSIYKNVFCLLRIFSDILEKTGRMLTGRPLPFEPLHPFLKTIVMFASFKIDGKSPLSAVIEKKSQTYFFMLSFLCFYNILTHSFPVHPFSTPWKHQMFSDIFRWSGKAALGTNGLNTQSVSLIRVNRLAFLTKGF